MFLSKNFGTVLADAAKFSGQIGFGFQERIASTAGFGNPQRSAVRLDWPEGFVADLKTIEKLAQSDGAQMSHPMFRAIYASVRVTRAILSRLQPPLQDRFW